MPELPEVESARRALLAWLPGVIDRVLVPDPACLRTKLSTLPSDAVKRGDLAAQALFVGGKTVKIARHGKRLAWQVGKHGILVHLGMTGRFVRREDGDEPSASTRIAFRCNGTWVWFEDRRRFGCLVPMPAKALDAAMREGHGPDALDEPLDGPGLAARATGKRCVKDALMDQAVLAGLGNIHVVEVLWTAKVHPETRADALTAAQWKRIAIAIGPQLSRFVEDPEAGDDPAYVNLGGDNPFTVYGREGEPCPRCGTAITRLAKARSTFFCAGCQA